jgi:N-acetyl-gamma-glutamyl-phosphate reductase
MHDAVLVGGRERRADLLCNVDGARQAIVVTAIDNLGKGAAGSAVQCMNLMLGLAETAGLDLPALAP